MRLFRLLFWLIMLGAFVWFGTTVRLGNRTLFGHLVAIAGTREAKDLADGTKAEAEKVAERVRQDLATDGGARHAPSEQLDDADRKALKKLVKDKSRP